MLPRRWLALPTLAVLAVLSIAYRLDAQTVPNEKATEETAPVELDGRVVLRVRGVSSFPAKARASAIEANIAAAAADRTSTIDSLHTVESEAGTAIVAGTRTLMTVTDADAELEQVERATLTAAHLRRLRQA